jgi:integrase
MPTANNLTDSQCRKAEPRATAYKMFDGHGLHLFVSPKGAKVWRVAYRLDGKPQTHTIGPYPLISLAEARGLRDELRKKLALGQPVKPEKARPGVPTLQAASDAYWDGRLDITDAYRMNAQNGITQHLGPLIGARPIDQVTRQDLLDALLEMDKAGLLVYVRAVRGWVSQVFDWAVERGHCQANPAQAIKPGKAFRVPAKESHAALAPAQVPEFFDRLSLEAELQSVLACKLLALTWVRTVELRTMLWSELEGKPDAWAMWRIPAGKMKRRSEHLVPLSRQAVGVLKVLRQRARGSEYVLPAEHTGKRPMSENAILYLLHRMGYKGQMTGHGWRSVASTWANEAGWAPDAIERQLAHVPDDKVRAAYNRAAYLPQRREMLQAWADWLQAQGMVTG